MNKDDLRRDCTLLATTLMRKYNYALYVERPEDQKRIDRIIEYSVQKILEMDKKIEESIENKQKK